MGSALRTSTGSAGAVHAGMLTRSISAHGGVGTRSKGAGMNDALVASLAGIAFTGILALAYAAGPLGVAAGLGAYFLVWVGVEMRYGGE